jgi:stage V sporulation protein B
MFIGALVKIAAEYVLVGRIGIMGAPISTLVCTLTVTVLNVYFICKYTPHRIDIRFLWRALASTVLAISASVGVYVGLDRFGTVVALFAAVLAAVIIYIPTGLKLRAVRSEDLLQLPKGEKIARLLAKLKLTEVKNEVQ